MILSTGETLGEIFSANAYRSYFMLFAYFYLHPVIDKTPTWKLFTLTLMEKTKAEKSPWAKKTKKKKKRPKEERNSSIWPKIIVSTSAGCEQVSSSESGGGDEEKEECDTKHWSIVNRDELNRQLRLSKRRGKLEDVVRTGLGAEWICRCRNPKCPSTAPDEKGVAMRYFSWEILIYCHRRWEGPVVPLVCGFISLRTFTSQNLAYFLFFVF